MKAFLDTNILIYAFGEDGRALAARRLLEGGVISVQSLNEFAAVARRKLDFSFDEIDSAISSLVVLCGEPLPVTYRIHRAGHMIAERYMVAIYDSMLAAAALDAECDILYSEDMYPGLVIDGRLRIVNPFAPA